jgi:hypothetical protein
MKYFSINYFRRIAYTLNVFVVILLIINSWNWHIERKLLREIIDSQRQQETSPLAIAKSLMNYTYLSLPKKSPSKTPYYFSDLLDKFPRTTTSNISKGGGCGYSSMVLADLLKTVGFKVRIASMFCENIFGCHVFVEAKIDGKFIILDPTYNLTFTNESGTPMGFDEVKENWGLLRKSLPKRYNQNYDYENVQYTNWSKNLLTKFLYGFSRSILQIDPKNISLRAYLLDVYKIYFYILISVFIFLTIISFSLSRINLYKVLCFKLKD